MTFAIYFVPSSTATVLKRLLTHPLCLRLECKDSRARKWILLPGKIESAHGGKEIGEVGFNEINRVRFSSV